MESQHDKSSRTRFKEHVHARHRGSTQNPAGDALITAKIPVFTSQDASVNKDLILLPLSPPSSSSSSSLSSSSSCPSVPSSASSSSMKSIYGDIPVPPEVPCALLVDISTPPKEDLLGELSELSINTQALLAKPASKEAATNTLVPDHQVYASQDLGGGGVQIPADLMPEGRYWVYPEAGEPKPFILKITPALGHPGLQSNDPSISTQSLNLPYSPRKIVRQKEGTLESLTVAELARSLRM